MHATVNVLNVTKLYNSEVFRFSDSEYHHASSHDFPWSNVKRYPFSPHREVPKDPTRSSLVNQCNTRLFTRSWVTQRQHQ